MRNFLDFIFIRENQKCHEKEMYRIAVHILEFLYSASVFKFTVQYLVRIEIVHSTK